MQKLILSKNLTRLVFILSFLFSTAGCSQEKTYWKATTFNKANKEPMHGATPDYISDLLTDFQYVIKDGNSFHLDFPTKKDIQIDTLQSFSYRRFDAEEENNAGKLIDTITDISISGASLQINFNFLGTLSDDNRFVLHYQKLTAAEYKKEIEDESAYLKTKTEAFEIYAKNYKIDPDWKTAQNAPTVSYNLPDSYGNLVATLPKNFEITEDGSFYKDTFDKIKAGTLAKNNKLFKIELTSLSESFYDAKLVLIKAPESDFDMKRYLAGKPFNFKVIEQDANSFHAVMLSYKKKDQSVRVRNYISFKHIYKNGIHVFYIADDENDIKVKNSKEFAKQHYMLMKKLVL